MQFEYKICILLVKYDQKETIMDAEAMLNKLGKEGWELVSSHPVVSSYNTQFEFKRKI